MNKRLNILGIETSCDETSAAVVVNGRDVLSNVISSQVDLHQSYGGVVPELASRRHLELINPVVDRALEEASLSWEDISAVAVTYGPGLVGSLLVGVSTAKSLAFALNVPLLAVHHLEGHIYATMLQDEEPTTPLICLTVSGGHTELIYISRLGSYEQLGRTLDDAAGEAFDKVARAMGLSYPGGPVIERLARDGDPEAISLPRPDTGKDNLDFSFSGLKTAVINYLNNCQQRGVEAERADLAASFQAAVIDVLVDGVLQALERRRVKQVMMVGGVAANRALYRQLEQALKDRDLTLFAPSPLLCTDNGAMIAAAGYRKYQAREFASLSLNVDPAPALY